MSPRLRPDLSHPHQVRLGSEMQSDLPPQPAGQLDWLTVLYDENCELCRRCRRWLEAQDQLVPLKFVAAGSESAMVWSARWRDATGGVDLPVGEELVVLAPRGEVWVGPDAFIVLLWALRQHRRLAARLSTPSLRPVARQVFHGLSAGRGAISGLLPTDASLADRSDVCVDGCIPTNRAAD